MSDARPAAPAGNGPADAAPRARTVFFGSGSFGVPVLDALIEAPEVELVGVVSVPDRPAGRHGALTPSPVAAQARLLGLPMFQPARLRTADTVDELAALAPDLGVLADYGRIVPPAILALPPHGILNLHPSLLPRHRGAAPIPATILEGDREAGVTLMLMDERLDAGPILASVGWPVGGDETAPELETRAAAEAAGLLLANLEAWLRGRLVPRPQDEAEATMTRPLTREDGRLDAACPADRLARQVRAFQPWPGSWLESPAGRLVVWRAEPVAAPRFAEEGAAGRDVGSRGLVAVGSGIGLSTIDGVLQLDEVQLAGGRRMRGTELLRGHPELVAALR